MKHKSCRCRLWYIVAVKTQLINYVCIEQQPSFCVLALKFAYTLGFSY